MRTFRTVLEQKIWERRQTLQEFAEFAETFAREHNEPGTLGVRHLQRLASGLGPGGRPLGQVLPATARLLEHILGLSVEQLLAPPGDAVTTDDVRVSGLSDLDPQASARLVPARMPGARRVAALGTSLDWLDDHAGWESDTSRRRVASRVGKSNPGDALDRHVRRAGVDRSGLARTLTDYYGACPAGYQRYLTSTTNAEIETTILSRSDWLDLNCPLTPDTDQVTFAPADQGRDSGSDEVVARSALGRLAEAAILDIRISNAPLYRLLEVDVSRTDDFWQCRRGSVRGVRPDVGSA